jgi:hypothetical protein
MVWQQLLGLSGAPADPSEEQQGSEEEGAAAEAAAAEAALQNGPVWQEASSSEEGATAQPAGATAGELGSDVAVPDAAPSRAASLVGFLNELDYGVTLSGYNRAQRLASAHAKLASEDEETRADLVSTMLSDWGESGWSEPDMAGLLLMGELGSWYEDDYSLAKGFVLWAEGVGSTLALLPQQQQVKLLELQRGCNAQQLGWLQGWLLGDVAPVCSYGGGLEMAGCGLEVAEVGRLLGRWAVECKEGQGWDRWAADGAAAAACCLWLVSWAAAACLAACSAAAGRGLSETGAPPHIWHCLAAPSSYGTAATSYLTTCRPPLSPHMQARCACKPPGSAAYGARLPEPS